MPNTCTWTNLNEIECVYNGNLTGHCRQFGAFKVLNDFFHFDSLTIYRFAVFTSFNSSLLINEMCLHVIIILYRLLYTPNTIYMYSISFFKIHFAGYVNSTGFTDTRYLFHIVFHYSN